MFIMTLKVISFKYYTSLKQKKRHYIVGRKLKEAFKIYLIEGKRLIRFNLFNG
jgi:hypothetical protein